MKNFLLLGAIFGSLALLGCGKSSSGDGNTGGATTGSNPDPTPVGSGYAATPQPCNVQNQVGYPQPANCQNYLNWYAGWNPYSIQWTYGAWYWPIQYQISGSNCGCPVGYYPVYGQTFGIACAPIGYFNSNIVYFNYWYYPQNIGPLNIPQIPYQGPAVQNTCAHYTAQGCDVRLSTCPSGSTCQPVGGGSTIGLCVR